MRTFDSIEAGQDSAERSEISPKSSSWLTGLKVCVSILLLARGWLTWHWDSPLRSLVWQEDWWTPLIEKYTESTWADFAYQSDPYITGSLTGIGIGLMLLSIIPWIAGRRCCQWVNWLLIVASAILLLDGFARFVNREFELGMAIEHSLQIGAPVLLFLALRFPERKKPWIMASLILAALTFVGHGLYAMGFHAIPLSFQLMTKAILPIGDGAVIVFLKVAGWLDILCAVGIFVRAIRIPSLVYMIVWGGLTALARAVAYFDVGSEGLGLDPWLVETLVRTPHWLIPALVLALIVPEECCRRKQDKEATPS
tara:strand:+ start:734 stop:1666 length:933 start_codon:yes stop_codon:yes gene_type:complete